MRILAISGSLRASSTNSKLVRAIIRLAPENMTFTLYEGLGDLPHFSPDIDVENAPPPVAFLRRQLQDANIVEGGTLIIPLIRTKLNEDGDVSDSATAEVLRSVLAVLAQTINTKV